MAQMQSPPAGQIHRKGGGPVTMFCPCQDSRAVNVVYPAPAGPYMNEIRRSGCAIVRWTYCFWNGFRMKDRIVLGA